MIAFTIYFGSLLGYYSSSAYYSYIYYATSFFIFSYFFYYSLKPGFFLNDLCSTISSDSLDSFYGSMISYFGGIFSFLLLLIFVLDLISEGNTSSAYIALGSLLNDLTRTSSTCFCFLFFMELRSYWKISTSWSFCLSFYSASWMEIISLRFVLALGKHYV